MDPVSSKPGLNQQGQAITEYLLLVAIVVGFFLTLFKGVTDAGLMAKLLTPLNKSFAKAYQHGHPDALGFDDGGPKKHPRADPEAVSDPNNFRIFYVAPK